MHGDYFDSSFDEDIFNTETMFEERYNKRKKMKEYLLKWKGYSSMNNVSKLEADLKYDALVSDYDVRKKKKKWKNLKSKSGASNSDHSGGCAYMVPCRGDLNGSPDAASPTEPSHMQTSSKEAKYSASVKEEMGGNNLDASNEADDEYDSHRLRMLKSLLGQSRMEKSWIPETIVSNLPTDNNFPLTYVSNIDIRKKVKKMLSSECGAYWSDMVTTNEGNGTSSKSMP